MAMRRLSADNIVAAVFDSNFGFSNGDSSRQEDGEDIYADRCEKAHRLSGRGYAKKLDT